MASNGSGDRVTNKQLYDELTDLRSDLPSRSEMRLTVALAVLGGNAVAALLMKYTGGGEAATQAARAVLHLL